jgi:hypothetical protein
LEDAETAARDPIDTDYPRVVIEANTNVLRPPRECSKAITALGKDPGVLINNPCPVIWGHRETECAAGDLAPLIPHPAKYLITATAGERIYADHPRAVK